MKYLLNFGFWSALALVASGCGKTTGEPAAGTALAAPPSFAWINTNVLQASCVKCHSGEDPAMGVDLSSYESLMASGAVTAGSPNQSELYLQISTGKMPKRAPRLSADKIAAVAAWIQGGAQK